MKDLMRMIRTLMWLSLVGAIYQELKRPAEERTWHGRVAGIVPYDFRVPTIERIRSAYWDPDTDEVFSDRVFGVGWAVNIPVAARKISELVTQYAEASASLRRDAQRAVRRADGGREAE